MSGDADRALAAVGLKGLRVKVRVSSMQHAAARKQRGSTMGCACLGEFGIHLLAPHIQEWLSNGTHEDNHQM